MKHTSNFGQLVRMYRKHKGWTQEELAERLGYTREYISHIEAGRRKLDHIAHLVRLADLLDIPSEQLENVGRPLPERKSGLSSLPKEESPLLQLLLTPGQDMIKFSYLAWLAGQHPTMEADLRRMVSTLDSALLAYHGQFQQPACQLLAYTHHALGKIAFDALDYHAADHHFVTMIHLGQALNVREIIALGMIRQGDVLRKRGRYEVALRCFEAAQRHTDASDTGMQGLLSLNRARVSYFLGDEQQFVRAITPALELASQMTAERKSLAYWFTIDVALQFQASGYTALGKPAQAIEVYKEIARRRPFRPLRDQGAYLIENARAYLEWGDLDKGVTLALRGLQLASQYRSRRHIARLEATSNRLTRTPLGREKKVGVLRDALREAWNTCQRGVSNE